MHGWIWRGRAALEGKGSSDDESRLRAGGRVHGSTTIVSAEIVKSTTSIARARTNLRTGRDRGLPAPGGNPPREPGVTVPRSASRGNQGSLSQDEAAARWRLVATRVKGDRNRIRGLGPHKYLPSHPHTHQQTYSEMPTYTHTRGHMNCLRLWTIRWHWVCGVHGWTWRGRTEAKEAMATDIDCAMTCASVDTRWGPPATATPFDRQRITGRAAAAPKEPGQCEPAKGAGSCPQDEPAGGTGGSFPKRSPLALSASGG